MKVHASGLLAPGQTVGVLSQGYRSHTDGAFPPIAERGVGAVAEVPTGMLTAVGEAEAGAAMIVARRLVSRAALVLKVMGPELRFAYPTSRINVDVATLVVTSIPRLRIVSKSWVPCSAKSAVLAFIASGEIVFSSTVMTSILMTVAPDMMKITVAMADIQTTAKVTTDTLRMATLDSRSIWVCWRVG